MLLAYRRAVPSRVEFLRVLRLRLAQSRVGWLLAPRPYETVVDVPSLGGQVRLRSHTTDVGVLEEMIATSHYGHLPSADVHTIVDLGANIGLAARWWMARHPDAQVVCVEPEPGNVAMLRRNVTGAIIPACIGGRERTVGLVSDHGDWAWRMHGAGAIPVVTMPTVLDGLERVDVLKCDVEGAEAELFDDCASWIGQVRGLIVECHAPYTAERLLADLERNGGRFAPVHHEANPAYGCETLTLMNSEKSLTAV